MRTAQSPDFTVYTIQGRRQHSRFTHAAQTLPEIHEVMRNGNSSLWVVPNEYTHLGYWCEHGRLLPSTGLVRLRVKYRDGTVHLHQVSLDEESTVPQVVAPYRRSSLVIETQASLYGVQLYLNVKRVLPN